MTKVLLVCAGGYSTGILMKKLEKYAKDKGIDFKVEAHGIGDYQDVYQDFDIILLGPQISYKEEEIKSNTNMPIDIVAQLDYALGNAENIFKQIDKLMAQLEKN